MRFDRAAIHRDLFDAQVVERGFVAVCFFVQRDADLVDDLVASLFLDRGLDQPRFASVNVVLSEDFFDGFDAALDRCFVVSRTVLPEQVFEDIGWNDCVALD